MFGNIVSGLIKVATLPIDIANTAMDVATGGNGSKRERTDIPLFGDIEKIRDKVCETAEEIDKK